MHVCTFLIVCVCDCHHMQAETQRIIWSYNPSDPANANSIMYHQFNRGSTSLNLLGGLESARTIPSDSKSFQVKNNNVSYISNYELSLTYL